MSVPYRTTGMCLWYFINFQLLKAWCYDISSNLQVLIAVKPCIWPKNFRWTKLEILLLSLRKSIDLTNRSPLKLAEQKKFPILIYCLLRTDPQPVFLYFRWFSIDHSNWAMHFTGKLKMNKTWDISNVFQVIDLANRFPH